MIGEFYLLTVEELRKPTPTRLGCSGSGGENGQKYVPSTFLTTFYQWECT
jgi:hypothetical protein